MKSKIISEPILQYIHLAQNDLNNYSSSDLQLMAKYYKIPQQKSKKDLAWALAVHIISQSNHQASMLSGTETLPQLRQMLNQARAAKAQLVAQIPEPPEDPDVDPEPTPQDLLDRIREKSKEIQELDKAIKEFAKKEEPKKEFHIPEAAADCTNDRDYITNEEWTNDNLPDIKIRFFDRDDITKKPLVYCGDRKTLQQFLDRPENHFAGWVPSTRGIDIEPEGYRGRPSQTERFVKIPGEIPTFILNQDFLTEFPEKTGSYVGLPVYKERRLGNLAGSFGVSELHGQAPGYTIYLVIPDSRPLQPELIATLVSEGISRDYLVNLDSLIAAARSLNDPILASELQRKNTDQIIEFIRTGLEPDAISAPYLAEAELFRGAQQLFPELYATFDRAVDSEDPAELQSSLAAIYSSLAAFVQNPENDISLRNRALVAKNLIEGVVEEDPDYEEFKLEFVKEILPVLSEQMLIKLIQDIVKDRYNTADYLTEWRPAFSPVSEYDDTQEPEPPSLNMTDFENTVKYLLDTVYLIFSGSEFVEDVSITEYNEDPEEVIRGWQQPVRVVDSIDDLDFLKQSYYAFNDQDFIKFMNLSNIGRLRGMVYDNLPTLTDEQVLKTIIAILDDDGGFIITTKNNRETAYFFEEIEDLEHNLEGYVSSSDSVDVITGEISEENKQRLLQQYRNNRNIRLDINLRFFDIFFEMTEEDLHDPDWQVLFLAVRDAANKNYQNIVEYLVTRGASIHDALRAATLAGNEQLVGYLIEKGADASHFEIPRLDSPRQYWIVVRTIASENDRATLDKLLQAGANATDALVGAADHNLIKYLIEERGAIAQVAFREKVAHNDIELIKFYLDSGFDINWNDEYLYDNAVQSSKLETIKFIVENGANDILLFYSAAGYGNKVIIKYLLQHGTAKKEGFDFTKAISFAEDDDHTEIANALKTIKSIQRATPERIEHLIADSEFMAGASDFPSLYNALDSVTDRRSIIEDIYIAALPPHGNDKLVAVIQDEFTAATLTVDEVLEHLDTDDWGFGIEYNTAEELNRILELFPRAPSPGPDDELQILLRKQDGKYKVILDYDEIQTLEMEISRDKLLGVVNKLKDKRARIYDQNGIPKYRII